MRNIFLVIILEHILNIVNVKQVDSYHLYIRSEGDSTKYYPKSYEGYSLESQKYVMKYRRRYI